MARLDDIKFVETSRQGDTQALHAMVLKSGERIAVVVRRRLGEKNPDWRDLVQDVLLAVLESLKDSRFDPQKGTSLQSYIYGITLNKIRDYFKANARETRNTTITHAELLQAEQQPQFEKEEMRSILRQSIARLKEKYQEVLYLRFYEELSIQEISQRTGLPPRRVSERLFYALKLLYKELEKENLLSIFLTAMIIYL
jgi:RNA polymerase sigma-70 factor (ECF subfamily)